MANLTSFDAKQLRTILGTFTTGVTVVTTRDPDGKLHGVTANSFSSVSLDPPLVLWSQALTSSSFEAFRESGYFAINILADHQIDLSRHFAKSQDDKFQTIDFVEGLGGVPVLKDTVAHFECSKQAAYPAGDHVIYIGRVERVGHTGRRPLAFAHGRYMVPYAHELGPLSLHRPTAAVATPQAVRAVTDALPALQQLMGGHTLSLAVWGNHGATIIRWQEKPGAAPETMRPGLVLSITRTAAGRAFAAFLSPEATRAFVEEDLRLYRMTDEDEATQKQLFDEELATTRTTGIALSIDREPAPPEQLPRTAFSVPIFAANGTMVMALTLILDPLTHDSTRDAPSARMLLQAGIELTALLAK